MTTAREGKGAHKVPLEDQPQDDRDMIRISGDDEDQGNEDQNTSAKERQTTIGNASPTMTTTPKPGKTEGLPDSSFSSIYVEVQMTVMEQSALEWQWLWMWDEFE